MVVQLFCKILLAHRAAADAKSFRANFDTENLGPIVERKTFLPDQVCQMVCFQTKNPNLGKFWSFTMLAYFLAI
jgi:hypothetical protein